MLFGLWICAASIAVLGLFVIILASWCSELEERLDELNDRLDTQDKYLFGDKDRDTTFDDHPLEM